MRVWRGGERYPGGDPAAGIESSHAFSFGAHFDPANLGFGRLIAANEERLAPGAGFEEHPHSGVEIVSWVLEGELTHESPDGPPVAVRPGDLQVLGAGSGVRHTERNAGSVPARFLQFWLTPVGEPGEPEHRVVRALPTGEPYPVLRAGAALTVHRPGEGERCDLPAGEWCYAHVAAGSVEFRDRGAAGEHTRYAVAGDAARIADAGTVTAVAAEAGTELLVWSPPR
ncbi:pirin family protein [Streptomyces alkaliphilus]|uniref:pirin family protein n=1 Tax=Streptomyces alkaliphilus TaxID=1472722 RepID=UPI00117E95A8|nr:pirin family protein [Streptomyces alkaliphilus]MQS09106.1 cupin domain-containing protein [Streptomyces alkaliphilus]